MTNSYGSIATDPNATTESGGGEGGSTSRKYIIATVVVLSGLLIRLSLSITNGGSPDRFILSITNGGSPDDADHWPGKLIKITKQQFPTTTVEAANFNWTKSDDLCDPLLGEAWIFGSERGLNNSVSLYFTPEVRGVDGVLSAIEVDYYGYVEEKLKGVYFTEEKTSKDGTYHSVSLALRKGDLCDKKNPAPPGNDPYMVISPGMTNTVVPTREDSPELLSNWKEGACLQNMGYHWESDVVGGKNLTYKAENMVPIVPMYSSTDKTINGIFFTASGLKQFWPAGCTKDPFEKAAFGKCGEDCNFWDPSPGLTQVNAPIFYMCSNFCGECEITGAKDEMFTTMHFFFKDTTDETCAKDNKQINCRSEKYPTMDTPSPSK